jgi:hypothetical protein
MELLSRLSTGGWVLFALWLPFALAVVFDLRTGKPLSEKAAKMLWLFGALTAWLLWLVTP